MYSELVLARGFMAWRQLMHCPKLCGLAPSKAQEVQAALNVSPCLRVQDTHALTSMVVVPSAAGCCRAQSAHGALLVRQSTHFAGSAELTQALQPSALARETDMAPSSMDSLKAVWLAHLRQPAGSLLRMQRVQVRTLRPAPAHSGGCLVKPLTQPSPVTVRCTFGRRREQQQQQKCHIDGVKQQDSILLLNSLHNTSLMAC